MASSNYIFVSICRKTDAYVEDHSVLRAIISLSSGEFLFSSSNSLSLIALNWEFVRSRTDTSVELNFCHRSHSSFFFLLYFFLLIFWIVYNRIEFNVTSNKICMIENMLIPSHNLYNS